jgi:hypothetical protein
MKCFFVVVLEDVVVGEEEGDGAHFGAHAGDGHAGVEGGVVGVGSGEFGGCSEESVGAECFGDGEGDVFGGCLGCGCAGEVDVGGGWYFEPGGAVGDGVGDVDVAHALAEGGDGAEDVGVAVGGYEGLGWGDVVLVDGEVGADALVDVGDGDVVGAGVLAEEVLVLCVFLVAAAWVAVEGEEGFGWVFGCEVVVLEVLDYVCAAEVARRAEVDSEFDGGVDGDWVCGVGGKDLLDEGVCHFVVLPLG